MIPDSVASRAGRLPTRTERFVVKLKDGQSIEHTLEWTPDVDAEPLDQFHLVLENSKYLRISTAVYACETVLSISRIGQDQHAGRPTHTD